MVVYGNDNEDTAMAITVGLPSAIATKLILNGAIKRTGVCIPTTEGMRGRERENPFFWLFVADIYIPVLNELETHGIKFHDVVHSYANPDGM